jgi:epoxyqueuosine reductase
MTALDARATTVKRLALAAGFDLVGIAPADPPPAIAHFAGWLGRGYAGEMAYLTRQAQQRSDVRRPFPWARTLVCVGLQYDTAHPYSIHAPQDRGWISRYAWGIDYHEPMLARLRQLAADLRPQLGGCEWRAYVDTGPILERAYAHAAGIGAWGKNTCLLHPQHGSWFFIGLLVTDLDLLPDGPRADMCGTCRACLDACPTQALVAPYVLDARCCISYLTIELKGAIPEALRPLMGRHVFGCDICQDVCPWNRKRRHIGPAMFEPHPGRFAPQVADLAEWTATGFSRRFSLSPVLRSRRRGFARNVAVALGNLGPGAREALERLCADEQPLVREHAQWARTRMRS